MEKYWNIFLMLLISAFASLIIVAISADHSITHYYIDGSVGELKIKSNKEWVEDGVIELDRDVLWPEAIQMVESLNKSLEIPCVSQ